jgi:hypothetical protein
MEISYINPGKQMEIYGNITKQNADFGTVTLGIQFGGV